MSHVIHAHGLSRNHEFRNVHVTASPVRVAANRLRYECADLKQRIFIPIDNVHEHVPINDWGGGGGNYAEAMVDIHKTRLW